MKNKKAFTLVELIVVITILAILGTIAFLNFSNYTIDANNTKTEMNLKSINKKISVIVSANNKIYLKDLLLNSVVGNQLDNSLTFASGTYLITGNNYNAGLLNFKKLGEDKDSYKDSDGNSYIYAYAYNLQKEKYFWQISGIIKNNIGNKIARVYGYYYKVDDTNDVDGLIKSISGSNSGAIVINNSGATLPY